MKKKVVEQNYLEKIPVKSNHIRWTLDDDGKVTLEIENKGIFNAVAQKIFKKPRISYIHLDETGSFIWPLIDGKTDIIALGELLKTEMGEKAEPLYERLAQFFGILESYGFITWNK